ncbi:MAG: enoyl-CoA hydratase-related protein, partial [Pseudomonadota bacterium]
LPPAVLKQMAFAGQRLSAERALELGFVNAVADNPGAEADAIAAKILTSAPQAVEVTKCLLAAALGEGGEASIEALAGAAMAASPEKDEGVAAFLEKRKPQFAGGAT